MCGMQKLFQESAAECAKKKKVRQRMCEKKKVRQSRFQAKVKSQGNVRIRLCKAWMRSQVVLRKTAE